MQKREKMVERRRSEGMAPVMAPRWEMVSRRDSSFYDRSKRGKVYRYLADAVTEGREEEIFVWRDNRQTFVHDL